MDIRDLILEFQTYLRRDGKSELTIRSYKGDIEIFLSWLNERAKFKGALTRYHVTSYKDFLMKSQYQINTINKKINSLNSFNHFLIYKKLCHEKAVYPNKDKIKIARGSEGEVDVFSPEEIEKILFYLEGEEIDLRHKLMFHLLIYTGLRVNELINLKVKDLDLIANSLAVIGKGGKYREIPIKVSLVEVIKDYLNKDRKDSKFSNSEYLLVTQRSEKMDKDTVNKVLNKHGKVLMMKIYPHKFRHTFCTRLLNRGVEITTVAKLAGHSNIQTTASFYINTSRTDKVNAVNLL